MNKIAEIQISYSVKVPKSERIKILESRTTYKVLLAHWNMDLIELQEHFYIILLNRNNEVLGLKCISTGGIGGTVVDIKLLFAMILKSCASGVIIAHNHPSGNLKKSKQDEVITNQIVNAANLFDIKVLDHLIVTKQGYYSFADNGEI